MQKLKPSASLNIKTASQREKEHIITKLHYLTTLIKHTLFVIDLFTSLNLKGRFNDVTTLVVYL
jgi:hypothetical protein